MTPPWLESQGQPLPLSESAVMKVQRWRSLSWNSDDGCLSQSSQSCDQTFSTPSKRHSPDGLMFATAAVRYDGQFEAPPVPHDAGHLRIQPPHEHTATHTSAESVCTLLKLKLYWNNKVQYGETTSVKLTCLLTQWWGVCRPDWTSYRWRSLRKQFTI